MIRMNSPMDGFYRYVTTLGLLIVAVSVYGFVRVFDNMDSEIKLFEVEYRRHDATSRQGRLIDTFVNSRVDAAKANANSLLVCGLVGVAIALLGAIPWYFKQQVHMDRIIRLQRTQLESADATKTRGDRSPPLHEPAGTSGRVT